MTNRYFFEGRNTAVRANSVAEARKRCKRGCGKLVKVHRNVPAVKAGQWDRTRPSGKKPSGPVQNRGYGPSKAASAKAVRNRKK